MRPRICVISGSRSEYGLLRSVIRGIGDSEKLQLQLVVTGAHLAHEFGLTVAEIEKDSCTIDRSVDIFLSSDNAVSTAKSMGLGVMGFTEALNDLATDAVVVLGDRYEIFSAVYAAHILNIPVVHISGGEITEGAFDDAFRHAITVLSQLHLVSTEACRRRVIQMIGTPDKVYVVGGLGVDNIHNFELLDKDELENELEFRFGRRNLLVTFHPVTREPGTAQSNIGQLLAALAELSEVHLIFTLPNSDPENSVIGQAIKNFVHGRNHCKAYPSLGATKYLSCLKFVDGVVGNSSSGLSEAPSFGIGTVDIGQRQHGREKAASVIDCKCEKREILTAIDHLYSVGFQQSLQSVENLYGTGGASQKIVELVSEYFG